MEKMKGKILMSKTNGVLFKIEDEFEKEGKKYYSISEVVNGEKYEVSKEFFDRGIMKVMKIMELEYK
jgi:hypothetical protein